MSLLLALKLLLVPTLISAASLAGRRWGPLVSGWLVGLPLTSGPVALFLALERGNTFAASAAQGILIGLISLSAFCLTYNWFATRMGWLHSMFAGWMAYLVLTFALQQFAIPLALSFALFFLVMAATIVEWGLVAAFGLAAIIALSMHGCSWWLLKGHAIRPTPKATLKIFQAEDQEAF